LIIKTGQTHSKTGGIILKIILMPSKTGITAFIMFNSMLIKIFILLIIGKTIVKTGAIPLKTGRLPATIAALI
jgi:hypothetical protein